MLSQGLEIEKWKNKKNKTKLYKKIHVYLDQCDLN